MKELFRPKNVYFILNSKIYVQVDDVVMGSSLGLNLANIFMVELEKDIIPTLSNDISLWRRYLGDTICFLKSNCINHVLQSLNTFYNNTKCKIEIEKGNKIAFLDILLTLSDMGFLSFKIMGEVGGLFGLPILTFVLEHH